jgi:hypothetical protein
MENHAKEEKPLTDDEKIDVAEKFQQLKNAVLAGGAEAMPLFHTFRQAYRGPSRALLDSFDAATDKREWLGEVSVQLRSEIDASFWTED